MAERRPLVLINGLPAVLPQGDTLPGAGTGGGGNLNSADAQVNFGTSGQEEYVEVVVPATWALVGTNIIVQPGLPTTADHDPEDALLEQLHYSVVGVNPGVSFTLGVHAPNNTWGRYDFVCIGV